jgi:hypothetical protein
MNVKTETMHYVKRDAWFEAISIKVSEFYTRTETAPYSHIEMIIPCIMKHTLVQCWYKHFQMMWNITCVLSSVLQPHIEGTEGISAVIL